jgi:hypothetical protein
MGYYATENSDNDFSIGNIYVGSQFALGEKKSSRLSVGFYLPTANSDSEGGLEVGLLSNFYNIERYAMNTFSIYTNYAYAHRPEKGFLGGLDVGFSVWIPTKDGDVRETEVVLHYGMQGGYQFNQFALWAEFNGILIVTEDEGDFADKVINQLFLGGQYTGGTVQPGLFYGINLDSDLKELIKGIFGIKIDVVL